MTANDFISRGRQGTSKAAHHNLQHHLLCQIPVRKATGGRRLHVNVASGITWQPQTSGRKESASSEETPPNENARTRDLQNKHISHISRTVIEHRRGFWTHFSLENQLTQQTLKKENVFGGDTRHGTSGRLVWRRYSIFHASLGHRFLGAIDLNLSYERKWSVEQKQH